MFDSATDSVTATIFLDTSNPPIGYIWPWGIRITPDGSRAVVTNYADNSVTFIDTSTNAILKKIVLSSGFHPRDFDFSPDGNFAYIPDEGSGGIAVIDMTTMTEIAMFWEGISPWALAVSANGTRAYVANYNSGFTTVDLATRTVLANIPMPQGTNYVALWEGPNTDTLAPITSVSLATIQILPDGIIPMSLFHSMPLIMTAEPALKKLNSAPQERSIFLRQRFQTLRL